MPVVAVGETNGTGMSVGVTVGDGVGVGVAVGKTPLRSYTSANL